MKYTDYEKAFSLARLNKYLAACANNKAKALALYRLNVKLCQKFYGILNIFEVVLRNSINEHYQGIFNDPDWIKQQIKTGKMLAKAPHRNEIERIVLDLQNKGRYSNDRIVSSMTFGFWTHLFTKLPFKLGGQNLLQIFPNRQKGIGQKVVFKDLMKIKAFRNRIAHHEAICFDSNGNIDVTNTKEHYNLILKYVSFLGYKSTHLFYGIDIIPDAILLKIMSL